MTTLAAALAAQLADAAAARATRRASGLDPVTPTGVADLTQASVRPIGVTAADLAGATRWLADYLRDAGKRCYVLGLSGGVDSAVVAMLAVRAVGPERVILVRLPYGGLGPSAFAPSAAASLEDAALVADAIADRAGAVTLRTCDIAPAVDVVAELVGLAAALRAAPADPRLTCWLGNLKARQRAVALRTIANVEDGLVLGTDNEAERYAGYSTTGGDEEHDLSVSTGFVKAEMRALARMLGVPAAVIDKAPSADLYAGQTDEADLGFSYDALDAVIRAGGATPPGLDPAVADQVRARITATMFKRAPRPTYGRPLAP